MSNARFVYVTYIRSTREKVWEALTKPEFTRRYWAGTWQESTWEAGAAWKIMIPDGRVGDSGKVFEIEKPRRLVLKWRNEFMPELKAEGYSQCSFELETVGDSVKLTVTHEIDHPKSKFIEAISEGWPHILASLKSLIETGRPLEGTDRWPDDL